MPIRAVRHASGMTRSLFPTALRRESVARGPRIAVLAGERSAPVVVKRLTAAGFRRVTVVADIAEVIDGPPAARADSIVVLLEPDLINREQLYSCDLHEISVLGLTAHRQHRVWAQLLPLCETLWLYAPPAQYQRALRAFNRHGGGDSPFRLEG